MFEGIKRDITCRKKALSSGLRWNNGMDGHEIKLR